MKLLHDSKYLSYFFSLDHLGQRLFSQLLFKEDGRFFVKIPIIHIYYVIGLLVGQQETYTYLNKIYYFFLLSIFIYILIFTPFLGNLIICSWYMIFLILNILKRLFSRGLNINDVAQSLVLLVKGRDFDRVPQG